MFTTQLRVSPIRGTTKRRLLNPLVFVDGVHGRIRVSTNFITDYASIPSIIPRWFIDQDAPFIRDASVLHDFLYSKDCTYNFTRKQADAIFHHAMLSLCKNSWDRFRAKIAYLAVRAAGSAFYKQNSNL